MPTCKLVALGNLALLGNVDADELINARRQVVTGVSARTSSQSIDLAPLAVRHLQ